MHITKYIGKGAGRTGDRHEFSTVAASAAATGSRIICQQHGTEVGSG